ncbi:MAG: hypothetical protein BM485_05425 [Desulfobulbaceae bacterium DB1]|nr:MAG: hypothetical protein BM485_05425 [Desulfobulbaceae bacterium DB1]
MIRKSCLFAFFWLTVGIAELFAATPHGESGIRCLDCHVSLPLDGLEFRFHDDLHLLCLRCHKDYSCKPDGGDGYFRHPIAVVPSFKIPADMPLDVKMKMNCMTCHLFHDEKKAKQDLHLHLLRRSPGSSFCLTCHTKLPGK